MSHGTPTIHALADVQAASIGEGTVVWQFAVICKGAVIGRNCNINCHTFIEGDVRIGDNVTVKAGVYLWDGTVIADDVFVGPNVTFTNDKFPRSRRRPEKFQPVKIGKGASLGAASTVLGGTAIGSYAIVGAGSLVTRDVPAFALVKGAPARIVGWVDKTGEKLAAIADGGWRDGEGNTYEVINNELRLR